MSGEDTKYGMGRIRVDTNEASDHFYEHFIPKPYLQSLNDRDD